MKYYDRQRGITILPSTNSEVYYPENTDIPYCPNYNVSKKIIVENPDIFIPID